jgi:shikimate dehydrogenase
MRFIGVNLTVPHKLLAFDMMDVKDESAIAWGAVNTVRFEGKTAEGVWRPLANLSTEVVQELRMHGFNTDAEAIAMSLRQDAKFEPKGAKILLLGAGGAGRVAALKMAAEGAKTLYLVNRSMDKAAAVAEEIHHRFPLTAISMGYPEDNVDAIINATSLGLKKDDSIPFDETKYSLGRAGVVYDMIYRPAETPLLEKARRAGCRTCNGLGMLLYQGAKALEIWSDQKAPIQIMRKALEDHIYGQVS